MDLLFPDRKTWQEIFSCLDKRECPKPGERIAPSHRWSALDYAATKPGKKVRTTVAGISSCVVARGDKSAYYTAKLQNDVVSALRDALMHHEQGYHVEIITRADGSALVLCQYNAIIGSRWIAEIDAGTLP